MTFAASVKEELCSVPLERECCATAECYGFLLFSKQVDASGIVFQTEYKNVARRYRELLRVVCGVSALLISPDRRGGNHTVSVPSASSLRVLERFGHTGQELSLRLNRANLEQECCYGAFLRGAFLACGTLSNPERDYHLEFFLPRRKLAEDLCVLLREMDLPFKVTSRRGAAVAYCKESEHIEDLLTMMQATQSTLRLMNIKIYKDVRNRVNRVTNCETANLTKTVEAVRRQTQAIERLQRVGMLPTLPAALQEAARLRLENPELSLSELGAMMSPPLSRSGMNHRLQKLMELAGALPEEAGHAPGG